MLKGFWRVYKIKDVPAWGCFVFKENYEAAGRRSLSGVEGRKTCFISGKYEMKAVQPGAVSCLRKIIRPQADGP